jgi:chromosome segregation ATPase
MSGVNKALVVAIVATLGLWGCARGPVNGPGAAERIKSLESKVAKLEDDFRAVAAARDQFRQKLVVADNQRKEVAKDRDDLRKQLTARTTERDTLQTQYDQFRKGLRDLLGQMDTAAAGSNQPITAAALVVPGKS